MVRPCSRGKGRGRQGVTDLDPGPDLVVPAAGGRAVRGRQGVTDLDPDPVVTAAGGRGDVKESSGR